MHKIKSTFINRWINNTLWGWLLGILFIIVVSLLLEQLKVKETQLFIGFSMGLGVGLTQWTALKKVTVVSHKWVGYTTLGMGIPPLIFALLAAVWDGFPLNYSLQINIAAGGLLTGIVQQPIIQKRFVDQKHWAIYSFFGWTVAGLLATVSDFNIIPKGGGLISAFLVLLSICIGGLALGYISSKALGIEDN